MVAKGGDVEEIDMEDVFMEVTGRDLAEDEEAVSG